MARKKSSGSKRSAGQQSKHDKTVSRVAGGYRAQGWNVQADLKGQPKPKTIGGHRPDVIAKKGKQERVIEVETKGTKDTPHAKDQAKAFRKWSRGKNNRSFRTRTTK